MDVQPPLRAANLPPIAEIGAALADATEVLARQLTVPTVEPPNWGEFEWRIARAVATLQGISSQLKAGLRWAGPPGWEEFLAAQRDHVAARHRNIAQLLERIDSGARSEGIALVALKGAALHANGVYEPGERPMADVDLLVSEADLKAATRLLDACGYEAGLVTWRHQLFEPRHHGDSVAASFGEHTDNPIKIELHTRILERLPIHEIDITQSLFSNNAHSGLNAYPSAASLMMHLLLHAAGNMRAHALRLIQLYDIARLSARFGTPDWEELLMARPNNEGLWWAMAPLMLTARYFPNTIPPSVITRLNAECPWLLRKFARRQRLVDVSWSNVKAYALPGIEWSRTPGEALRFIMSRIWPGRDARAELHFYAAHHPGASTVRWYGISQGARILRWIFLKPPRVQTLLVVRAALSQAS
jgi:hypothetical protein